MRTTAHAAARARGGRSDRRSSGSAVHPQPAAFVEVTQNCDRFFAVSPARQTFANSPATQLTAPPIQAQKLSSQREPSRSPRPLLKSPYKTKQNKDLFPAIRLAKPPLKPLKYSQRLADPALLLPDLLPPPRRPRKSTSQILWQTIRIPSSLSMGRTLPAAARILFPSTLKRR